MDITKRKKAEEALRERMGQYKALFENAPSVMLLIDPENGDIVDANSAALSYYGWSHEEITGKKIYDINTLAKEKIFQEMERANKENRKHFFFCHRLSNNEIRDVEVYSGPIAVNGRKLLFSIVHDITEKKQAEEKLKEADRIINMSPAVAFLWKNEENWPVEYVSDKVEELFGYTVEEWMNGVVLYSAIVHPDDLERVGDEVSRYSRQANCHNFIHEPYRIITKAGDIKWVDDRTTIRRDGNGVVTHFQGVVLDITERKQAEEDLRRKDKQLTEITSRLPCLVFQFIAGWDGSRTVSYVNGQVEKMLGLAPDPQGFFERFTAAVLIDQRSDFINIVEKAVREVAEWKYEGPIAKPSGEIIWISGIASPTKTSEGIVYDGVIVDITERKLTAETLRASEAKYRSAYTMMRMLCDNVPDMIWAKDLDKRYIFANKAICSNLLNAVDTDEPMGKMDMFFAERERTAHPDNPEWHTFGEICRDTDAITMAAGRPQQFDEYGNVQGEFLFLDVHKAPFLDENGRIIGTVGSARDVTTTKEMERRLMNKEALLQAMLRNLPFDFWARDKNDHIIIQSNKSLDLWGDLIQNPIEEKQFDKKTLELWKSNNRRVLAGEIVSEESTLVTRNGEPRQFHNIVVPILNEAEILGLLGINIDITDRKQAEEALRESEQRYRQYITNTPYGVFVTNEKGEYTQVNPAACRITGYTAEELLSMSIPDLLLKETLAEDMRHFQTLVREGKSQCEIRFCPKNGERRWWSVSAVKISDKRFLGFCNDITDRKFAEEERANLEKEKIQLQKTESLSRMAGAIAHHFNNQLGAVIGNLEMAIDDLPQDTETARILIAAMRGARNAVEVSSLMVTYLGQTTAQYTLLDLSNTCRQSLPLFQAAIPGKVTFKVDLPSPGPIIKSNANQIQQVLTNLVTNAWEATDNNQGIVGLTVKIVSPADISAIHRFPVGWQSQDSAYACMEVTDTGCGIADETIEKLFDPFFSSKFTGRGLGLSVVLGIVKTHGGAVTVESKMGQGSTFRVFLPMLTEQTLPQSEAAAQALEIEGGGTVLLVEDEEVMRNMAQAMLTRLGFKVLDAKDGVEAIEVFQKHLDEIHVVISDLSMPRMNGWETLAALRQIRPDIPVVLVSGHDEAHALAGNHLELPQGFLHKPYKKAELKESLARAMKKD